MAATANSSSNSGDGGERRSLPPRHETFSSGDDGADGAQAKRGMSSSTDNGTSARAASPATSDGSHGNAFTSINTSEPQIQLGHEGEGLEVVISRFSDELDAVEFKLPDDGSSAPLDANMSRAASSHSLA